MEKGGKNIWLICLSLIQTQVLPEKFKTLLSRYVLFVLKMMY